MSYLIQKILDCVRFRRRSGTSLATDERSGSEAGERHEGLPTPFSISHTSLG